MIKINPRMRGLKKLILSRTCMVGVRSARSIVVMFCCHSCSCVVKYWENPELRYSYPFVSGYASRMTETSTSSQRLLQSVDREVLSKDSLKMTLHESPQL